jgi:hypothetical protein
VGSSATSRSGSTASARAIATRWRCPPESSYGCRWMKSSAGPSPTVRSRSVAFSLASSGRARPWRSSGRTMWCATSCTGFSDPNGSWKTIWTRPRYSSEARRPSFFKTSTPSSSSAPASGCSRRRTMRASVLLPLPDSPTSATASPRRTSKQTSSAATTRRARPANPAEANVLRIPRSSRRGGPETVGSACTTPPISENHFVRLANIV